MRITFCGAAQTVTGSNFLVETGSPAGELKFLVDCGMFQGSLQAEAHNKDPFPYDAGSISAVLLTHSHADHSGRLPKLYKDGFRGPLYATPPTLDMTRVALPDNLSLLTSNAKREQHEPFYTAEDVEQVIALGSPVSYGQEFELASGINIIFHDAGHILGSAIIEVQTEGKRVYFSGDLGNPPAPLLRSFEYPLNADYVVVDATYGNRIHEDRSRRLEKFRQVVRDTITRGGTLMIPSFDIERTQELLFELNGMANAGEIPPIPMFIDSPLAIRMTEVYQKYPQYFNTEAMQLVRSGDDLFNFPGLKYMRTAEESKKINDMPAPKVIIAGSGMSNGGRIQHHERRYLSDPNSSILFIGFQAEGTLGRRIFDGAPEVRIFDETVPVRCHIQAIGGYSAHADQPMIIDWLTCGQGRLPAGRQGGKLKRVFTVHGEADSTVALANAVKEKLSVDALAPTSGQTVEL